MTKPIKDEDFFRTHQWIKDEMGSEFIIEVDKRAEFINAQKDKVPDEDVQEEREKIVDLNAILENGADGVLPQRSSIMARSNVDAIYAENPFLSKLIARVKVPDAQVKRWSEEFLASTPDTYPDSGTENIYLLDEHGDIVARVGSLSDRIAGFLGFHQNSETVGQALVRIGDDQTRRVRYAVGVWHKVVLWKLPNGHNNAADWLASTVTETRKKLRQS